VCCVLLLGLTDRGDVPQLRGLIIKSYSGSRKRVQGLIETHFNGFRIRIQNAEEIRVFIFVCCVYLLFFLLLQIVCVLNTDVLFNNIKHAFFQRANNTIAVILHFHLRNPIVVGGKRTSVCVCLCVWH